MDFVLLNQTGFGDVSGVITYVYDGSAAHHPCLGQEGSFRVIVSMLDGTPPYTVTANGMPPIGYDLSTNDPYFGYFSQGETIWVDVIDGAGCTGSGSFWMDGINTAPFSAENINPTCGGFSNGSADLYYGSSGPYGPSLVITDPFGGVMFSGEAVGEPLMLTDLAPGTYTVQRSYSPVYMAAVCEFTDQFTIPDLGVDCGTVNGTLYIDNDQDCVQDAQEVGVPYRIIEITPGPQYAITNAYGEYSRWLVNGSYQLLPQGTGVDLIPICPVTQPVPFTINSDAVIIDIADSSNVQLDVRVDASANVARPGFAHNIWCDVRNISPQISGPIMLTATIDPVMTYLNAAPTPTSVVGNVITWEYPSLTAYADYDFAIYMQVPPNAGLIGQAYQHTLSVAQALAESSVANNTHGISGTITGSYDPNDKIVHTSSGYSDTQYFIGSDESLDYTIRFQNTGTDTAFNIVVTDTIGTELDLSTYQQGPVSHPFSVAFKEGRVVEWAFENILLPDSNVNEAASHGLVSFRIRPVQPVLPGTLFVNNADIFFDFNDPIRTPDAVVIAEMSTGIAVGHRYELNVYPNPAHDRIRFVQADPGAGFGHVVIRSMDGREVLRRTGQEPLSEIGIGTLSKGTYILELRTSGGKTRRAIFVKE